MDLTLLVFLPMILALGIITSYEDIKFGKIRNKFIVIALVYAVLAYIIVVIYLMLAGFEVRISYIFDMIINIAISITFGFVAWNARLWSAADAKLFMAYAFLVPLSSYSKTYLMYFPAFVLLINTFVPAFFFLIFRIIIKTSLKEKLSFIREIDFKEFPTLLVNLFWITWLSRLIGGLGINLGPLGGIFIVWSIIFLLYRYSGEYKLKIGLFMAGARAVFDFGYIITMAFAFEMLYYTLLTFGVFLVMIFVIHFSVEPGSVPLRSLKPGMIIADIIYKEGGKYKKLSMIKAIEKPPRNRLSLDNLAEGLTERDISKLKELHKNKKLDFSGVKIKQMLPFAPFMFLGVLLTIMAEGFFMALFF
jgi:hypothetical protein